MNRSITKSSTTLLLAALALLLATPAAVAQIEPPEDWLAEVTEGIQAQEYHFSWKADGQLSAPNRAHDLRTSVTGSGFRVVSRTEGESKFDLDLRLVRFGRGENGAAVGAGELAGDEGRVDLHRPGLTEWFVNDDRGLEHGFDIPEPPAGTRGEVVLVLALEGSLLAYPMGNDGRGVLLRDPKGDDVLQYAGLTVLDAVGNELPARIEIAIGEIRILFDDGDAVYPVTVDPVLSGVVWNVTGLLFWGLGASVSTAGDVNGDGFSDVIVGTPLYDGGQTDEGLASVYHGSPTGLSTAAAWSFVSGRQQARFGAAVSTAGDVNSDGYDDVIIGSPHYFNGHLEEGRAYVFHGSASGLSGSPWITESNEVFAHYGTAVDFAGDVNNDGYHDVVVGAPLLDLAAVDGGAIYVYFGSSAGLSTVADWIQPSAHAGALFGTSVAGAGDVNGDGFADVAGGAPGYDLTSPLIEDRGRVYVYHGSAGVPAWATTVNRNGNSNLDDNFFGFSVAGAGDLNGDGYADIVVGAPGHYEFVPENRAGSFSVFYGSASGITTPGDLIGPSNDHLGLGQSVSTAGDINGDGFADIIVGAPETEEVLVYCGSRTGVAECANPVSLQNGSEFGATVNTAGDVNGDGYSDVIVGSPSYAINSFVYGRAYVYHGGPDGLVTDPEINNGNDLGRLGMAVASAGDVNGDGFSDVLFGEPEFDGGSLDEGRVFIHYGSRNGLTTSDSLAIFLENGRFGAALSGAGDVDGDGYDDVVVGAPGFGIGAGLNTGRIWVYLGGPSGLGTASTWTVGGNQADSFFGSALASGDVNGDGYSDVVVGAYGQDGNEGEVWVYQGSASGLLFSSNWPISTDVAGGEFGRSVAMGDINGDGYSETIVGAPEDSTVGGGRIYLFNGSAEGPASTFTFAYGGTPGESLGWSVASGGDVNGDGLEEFVVGGPGFSSPELGEGRILLFGGYPGGGIVVLASRQSDVGGAFLGLSVALVGDANGDGYSEVVAGAPSHTSAGSTDPFVWVWHGSPSGITSSFSWESGPGVLGSRTLYGASVAGAGDVNGDGFDELLVGVPDAGSQTIEAFGAVSLYLGGGGHGMDRIPRQQQPFGTSDPPVALRGRSTDDDSVRLRSRARTAAGRDLVQVEYEVKALGDPLDGTGTTLSNSELLTSSPGSDGSRVNYSTRINGLTDGPYYHWRLRFLSPNPKFPHTPWMRCPGIAPTQRGFMTSCNTLAWYRDSDGDGYGSPAYRLDRCDPQVGYVLNGTDCDDFDEDVFPGAPEINNGQDDQCSGDPGYGLVDEIEPSTGFDNPSVFCWTAQSGATGYEVARSTDPTFQSGCESFFVEGANCIFDTDVPPDGSVYNYLVRAADPFFGSWGIDSNGDERTVVCP